MNAAGSFSAGIAPTVIGATIQSSGWEFSYLVIFVLTFIITISISVILIYLNTHKKKS